METAWDSTYTSRIGKPSTQTQPHVSRAAARVFGPQGLVNIRNDEEMRDIRNKSGHDEVLRRAEAQQTRTWVMKLLGQV